MSRPQLKVRDLMSAVVLTVRRNDKLSVPDNLMKQERIRHIPVLNDDDDLCGVVTQRDLFRGAVLKSLGYGSRAEDRLLESLVVKEAMTENPQTTSPETPLADAARLMLEHQIGCLPVLDDEKLVGMLTEGDFVRLAAGDGREVPSAR